MSTTGLTATGRVVVTPIHVAPSVMRNALPAILFEKKPVPGSRSAFLKGRKMDHDRGELRAFSTKSVIRNRRAAHPEYSAEITSHEMIVRIRLGLTITPENRYRTAEVFEVK